MLAAFSTRKLRTAYAGSALKVQRLNDNAQQDIGFAADGSLDETSLATFVGANDARLITWYDQSGNANNFSQATATNGPRIRNSSTNEVINSTRLAPLFNSFYLSSSLACTPTNVRRFFACAHVTDLTAQRAIMGGDNINIGLEWRIDQTTGTVSLLKQDIVNIATSSGTVTSGTASIVEASYDNTNYTFFIDGAASGSGSNAQTLFAANFWTGARSGPAGAINEPFVGHIGEIIITDVAGDISSATRQALEANMKSFWGTP